MSVIKQINYTDLWTFREVMDFFFSYPDLEKREKNIDYTIKGDNAFLLITSNISGFNGHLVATLQVEALSGKYKFYNPKDFTVQERNACFMKLYEGKKFTQTEMATLLGVSQSTISVIKRELILLKTNQLF